MFEIYSLVGNDAKKQFKAFLEKLDFHSRDSLDRDIPRVKGLVGKEITLEKVTEIIRMVAGKYVTWKPRLEHQAFEQAVRSAKSEGYNTHGGTVGVISFFALMFTSLFFLFSRGIRPDSNSVTPYWVFGTLAGAILVGSLVGSFEKRTRISRNTTARMASNYASLNANLESVGLSEAKPRHTLPIIAILLPIYVAVIIFYIVEWFAIMSGQQVKPLARVSPSSFGSRSAEASLFPIPHARVNRVRFFGSGYDAAPIGHRFYAASFPRQTSKYINWELDLTFPRVNRNYKFPIQTEWIGPRGNVFWRQTAWASVSAGWASMWESSGWGCRNPPCAFERGRYHVNLYVRGAKVASGTFEMY
ncbi:MAG: hypothetical protein M1404_05250 [Acidobacteria bacterium]|nr:hypothetical protein [Acidobacteriota bacterium]